MPRVIHGEQSKDSGPMSGGYDRPEEPAEIAFQYNKRRVGTTNETKRPRGGIIGGTSYLPMKVTDLNSMVQIVKKRPRMKHVDKVAHRENKSRVIHSQ